MTTTTHAVALSPSEWAERCGLDEETMRLLLETMREETVEQDAHGRWSLAPSFLEKFARPFAAAFEIDDDEIDDAPDTQGAVFSPFGFRIIPLRPAPSKNVSPGLGVL